MERYNDFHSPAAGSLKGMVAGLRHVEHPLLRIPILLSVALGVALGMTRLVIAVRENLQSSPSSLGAILFLAAIVGGAALVIVLFSAAVGFFIGLVLEAGYGWLAHRKRASLMR